MTRLLAQVNVPTQFLPIEWRIAIVRLGQSCTGGRGANESCNFQPSMLITILLPNVLMVAGIIFFVWIIVAGWAVLAGAGHEASAQEKAKAQAALTYAVVGFLLIISAFFILQIIETVTGINFVRPNI